MAKRNRKNEAESGDTWLNTYADMVTLLLTFFAVLISMSSVDQGKFNAFIKSLSMVAPEKIDEKIEVPPVISEKDGEGAQEDPMPSAMDKLYQNLKDYIEKNNKEDSLEILKKDEVVYIRFSSAVFFLPDKYELRPDARETLDFIGNGLKEQEKDIKIINVCGHTADPPKAGGRGSNEWLLAGERAGVVARTFEDDKKIDPHKIITFGYGDNFPVADNSTEEGRIKNRRVELVIIGVNSDVDFNAYDMLSDLYNDKKYPTKGNVTDILVPSQK